MPRLSQQNARQRAYCIVASQLVVTVITAMLFALTVSWHAGVSAVTGGAINATGTFAQVLIAFVGRATHDPRRVARAFYRAEAVKLLTIVTLFALVLQRFQLALLPMITAFSATLFVFLAALLVPLPEETNG